MFYTCPSTDTEWADLKGKVGNYELLVVQCNDVKTKGYFTDGTIKNTTLIAYNGLLYSGFCHPNLYILLL